MPETLAEPESQVVEPEPQVLIDSHTIREIKYSDSFFKLLPEDWKECLIPYWKDLQKSTGIYGIFDGDTLLGGGLIFHKPAPDTSAYQELAQSLFQKGYLYIGFLWIEPHLRGNGLGKQWIEGVRSFFPDNRFWLAIEDEDLKPFYNKNGFRHFSTVQYDGDSVDWIFIEI